MILQLTVYLALRCCEYSTFWGNVTEGFSATNTQTSSGQIESTFADFASAASPSGLSRTVLMLTPVDMQDVWGTFGLNIEQAAVSHPTTPCPSYCNYLNKLFLSGWCSVMNALDPKLTGVGRNWCRSCHRAWHRYSARQTFYAAANPHLGHKSLSYCGIKCNLSGINIPQTLLSVIQQLHVKWQGNNDRRVIQRFSEKQ